MKPVNPRFEIMDDCMVPVLQAKTPAERLAIVFGMWKMAFAMIGAVVRHTHPEWTEEERRREVARRMSRGAF